MERVKQKQLIAWYPFDGKHELGEDLSVNKRNAKAMGTNPPVITQVGGRDAALFFGGENGDSYIQLPDTLLEGVNDGEGLSVSAWVYFQPGHSVWERVLDFGNGETGPYLFLTRNLRGVCFADGDLAADEGKAVPEGQWIHLVYTVSGTKGGNESSAGPRIYVNGELWADGMISQTSSGNYKSLRTFWDKLETKGIFVHNYIGKSQFGADPDFCGAIRDFRVYSKCLQEDEIISELCESLTEAQTVWMAKEKFLPEFPHILTEDIHLPKSLMDGRVNAKWSCSPEHIIDSDGRIKKGDAPVAIELKVQLSCGQETLEKTYRMTYVPQGLSPYELTIHGKQTGPAISKTLYGLFFEDINHSADGGIYAEMIQNRSFEEFSFDIYDARSGENGISTGRVHDPLKFWFGDLDLVQVQNTGGLNAHFGIEDDECNAHYLSVEANATLYNRGFCDNRFLCSMNLQKNENYRFSLWVRTEENSTIELTLFDSSMRKMSDTVVLKVEAEENGGWKKYAAPPLVAKETGLGQLQIHFSGAMSIDMLSLMPQNVWGAEEEAVSESAHRNYLANENYRLRRDLVESLVELHPSFLRFPGGCISEGSYIWDNVYDWKDSVGPVEIRKENFNVWGYTMTLGLGYMEYFQLAEDLQAEPLPVMACGVLCQARSDYANPAGGALREKYIRNFTDLIDFALSTDFENNRWAALRRQMGHEAPFGLHYLGVGNENWGTEFFANFEAFYHEITEYVKQKYPNHNLTIVSTAGAQADDDAYQNGWRFLAGYESGTANIAFSDGKNSWEEETSWYSHQKNYLDTIVDEHYYRSNEYLLENVDRYQYYDRPYENGTLVEDQVSKVFVGEYASSDKNTLAGAVAEAAVMTGFENNSDVVRLAATAPLFNKVGGDGTYRWTPDCIWFDDEAVWKTPNYYVQQMFAEHLGTEVLNTSYSTYEDGKKTQKLVHGDAAVFADEKVSIRQIRMCSMNDEFVVFEDGTTTEDAKKQGIRVIAFDGGYYLQIPKEQDRRYRITVEAAVKEGGSTLSVAGGICGTDMEALLQGSFVRNAISMHEYCVGAAGYGTGLKVYKDGKQGYTMGDYSSSVYAGNLRRCFGESLEADTTYVVTLDFAEETDKQLLAFYRKKDCKNAAGERKAVITGKLAYYNRDIFHSVTQDENNIYVKMVNADAFCKKCDVYLEDIRGVDVTRVSLFATQEKLVHMQNVNTRLKEEIVPVVDGLSIQNGRIQLEMPGNSVQVLIIRKEE